MKEKGHPLLVSREHCTLWNHEARPFFRKSDSSLFFDLKTNINIKNFLSLFDQLPENV